MTITMSETEVSVDDVQVPMVVMPYHVLRDLLSGCLIAAGKDDTLPSLMCVKMGWSDGGELTAAATDRYRLIVGVVQASTSDRQPVTTCGVGSILIPRKAVEELVKALPKRTAKTWVGSTVTITVSGKYATFTFMGADDSWNREVLLLEADFPKWRSLIPTSDMLDASKGVQCMTWNPAYMADFAKVPTSDRNNPITFRFTEPSRPMLGNVKHDHIDWKLLLMPVRLTT